MKNLSNFHLEQHYNIDFIVLYFRVALKVGPFVKDVGLLVVRRGVR